VIFYSSDNDEIEYQASSPDEKALMMFVKSMGIALIGRTPHAIQVQPTLIYRISKLLIPNIRIILLFLIIKKNISCFFMLLLLLQLKNLHTNTEFSVDILRTIEFTSDRRCMSVVCRFSSGRIVLFCKGADTVILERLNAGNFNFTLPLI
jgi:phospholipid-transporting ATPase